MARYVDVLIDINGYLDKCILGVNECIGNQTAKEGTLKISLI